MLKDDFNPKAPISQVPASWFNKGAKMLNGLVGGFCIEVDKSGTDAAKVEIGLRKDYADQMKIPQYVKGTPEDKSDTGTDDDQDGSTWEWVHDNQDGKGLIVTPYCKIEDEQGWHYFGRVKMTFSKSGLLMKAEGLAGRREIQA